MDLNVCLLQQSPRLRAKDRAQVGRLECSETQLFLHILTFPLLQRRFNPPLSEASLLGNGLQCAAETFVGKA